MMRYFLFLVFFICVFSGNNAYCGEKNNVVFTKRVLEKIENDKKKIISMENDKKIYPYYERMRDFNEQKININKNHQKPEFQFPLIWYFERF